jgi:hypothetical protein
MTPVTSRDELVEFIPPGSPRSYTLAPLTYRQRQAFRADMAREGGIYPSRGQLLETIRRVVRELAPSNAAELLEMVDAAEADAPGDDADLQNRLSGLEASIATQPAYAALVAARVQYTGMIPFVAARHALRGWEGPGLPDFARDARGLVPEDLLEGIPQAELQAIGNKAADLMQPAEAASGN